MNDNQIVSMKEYYEKKHGLPIDDKDAIYRLVNAYKELFGEVPTQEIEEGIAEYYRILTSRDLPAYLWILESFHVTSKKDKEKRSFSYCVGMLRTWMKHGFGNIPNQEEAELANYFQELTGQELTPKARTILENAMGTYGTVKTAIALSELKSTDFSYIIMSYIRNCMDNKYKQQENKTKEEEVAI